MKPGTEERNKTSKRHPLETIRNNSNLNVGIALKILPLKSCEKV
jgi:hypothetical protein